MNQNLFNKKPLKIISDIPIFSKSDSYVENYSLIAADHITSLQLLGRNPFMIPEQIRDSNSQTQILIAKYTQQQQSILDAGLGPGDLLADMPQFNRYGVDITLDYLKIAKSKNINVAMAKIEELPFHNEFFSTVVACDVLEHVQRLDLCIEQMMRVLKPGGFMILRIPNDENLDSYLSDNSPYSHIHLRQFSLTSLRLLLEKCFELKFIESKYVGYYFTSFSQMKYQFPSSTSGLITKLNKVFDERPELLNRIEFKELNKLQSSTFELIGDILLSIRDGYPDIFKILAPDLIKPLEIIAVFKKV
jgi:ubiquinone/menaquinone biosynthesis C-methylase UbiE